MRDVVTLIQIYVSGLDGGGRSTPHPHRFTRGKEKQHSIYRSLGGPQGMSRQVWKISLSLEFQRRTIQSVAIPYTDYIIGLVRNKIFTLFGRTR